MKTEKEKYFNWLNKEKQKGLNYVDFFVNPNLDFTKITEESIYAELNRMIEAADLSDKEVLGNRSI